MENFKNKVSEGEIVLTPTKWLKELVNEFKKHEQFKLLTNVEVLDSLCIPTYLESYEQGYTPQETVENEFESMI